MRGTTPIFPVEPLNNVSVSFQVSVPFNYRIGVQPISLTSSEPAAGSIVVVSGWGENKTWGEYPSQLQAVNIFINPRAECYSITENQICAGVPGGVSSPCPGDTGGPLVLGCQLVGIVSWGVGCGVGMSPVVYSNVATLKSFITQETGVQ